jgi:hypothetical protein
MDRYPAGGSLADPAPKVPDPPESTAAHAAAVRLQGPLIALLDVTAPAREPGRARASLPAGGGPVE